MANRYYRDKSTKYNYEERPVFPVDPGETEPRKRTGMVANAQNVKIRESASLDSKVLMVLRKGVKIDILDKGIETNGFKHVKVSDTKLVGFILSKFCKEER